MKLKTGLLFSLAVLSPTLVFGLGIRLADQDPFATARGNAFVATADNPAAIYYNPAGIVQLSGQNLRVGVYGVYLDSHYSAPGNSIHTRDTVQAVPQIFYTYGFSNVPITLGLGIYSPYGLGIEWPDTAPFSPVGRKGSLEYITINPVIAWQVVSNFSVAAGPTINYGNLYLNNDPFGAGAGGTFAFHGNDVCLGFNAGMMWQPCSTIVLGANYRSETRMDFSGHSTLTGFPPTSASASMPFPQNVVGGISYRPTKDWNIEFDADWTDWHALKSVTVSSTPPGGAPNTLPFFWESSFFYELGVTRYLDNGWRVSGGYIYSENSVPDATFNPLVPDSDRHIWSVGVGRTWDNWSCDAAYQFAWGPARTVAAYGGSFEYISHALTISVGYHF